MPKYSPFARCHRISETNPAPNSNNRPVTSGPCHNRVQTIPYFRLAKCRQTDLGRAENTDDRRNKVGRKMLEHLGRHDRRRHRRRCNLQLPNRISHSTPRDVECTYGRDNVCFDVVLDTLLCERSRECHETHYNPPQGQTDAYAFSEGGERTLCGRVICLSEVSVQTRRRSGIDNSAVLRYASAHIHPPTTA